jgi:hypothetical protein
MGKLTPKQTEEILEMLRKGARQTKAAAKYNVTRQAVSLLVKRAAKMQAKLKAISPAQMAYLKNTFKGIPRPKKSEVIDAIYEKYGFYPDLQQHVPELRAMGVRIRDNTFTPRALAKREEAVARRKAADPNWRPIPKQRIAETKAKPRVRYPRGRDPYGGYLDPASFEAMKAEMERLKKAYQAQSLSAAPGFRTPARGKHAKGQRSTPNKTKRR